MAGKKTGAMGWYQNRYCTLGLVKVQGRHINGAPVALQLPRLLRDARAGGKHQPGPLQGTGFWGLSQGWTVGKEEIFTDPMILCPDGVRWNPV